MGPMFLDIVLIYWWIGLVPDTTGCGFQECPKAGEFHQTLGWRAGGSKVS